MKHAPMPGKPTLLEQLYPQMAEAARASTRARKARARSRFVTLLRIDAAQRGHHLESPLQGWPSSKTWEVPRDR